jgi:hypothetical protein
MSNRQYLVITSISNQNSPGVKKLLAFLENYNLHAVVVADKKTPIWNSHPNIDFLSLEMQEDYWPKLSQKIPFNHYSRKNLGYLRAISLGAESILDTDDDNCPTENPWEKEFNQFRLNHKDSWINIYRYFGEKLIWPRGLPLRFANDLYGELKTVSPPNEISCFQSIVDGDPDIDAIGRLLYPNKIFFSNELPIILDNGTCPTNSQATIWMSWLLPLLYLPSTATFRMTDIWRGLIAQPAIKSLGGFTVFGKLGFNQDRNEHDLMKDFESEISGHLYSEKVTEISSKVWKSKNFERNNYSISEGLFEVYEKLTYEKIIEFDELQILQEWIDSVTKL